MFVIAGLGNPGPKYAGHRHNVGFMLLDRLAAAEGLTFRQKFKGEIARCRLGGEEAILLKPQTYMNLSGESLQAAVKFFKVDAERVVVVHDELDLAFGRLRIKLGGGTAGHNGLKSIVSRMGGDFCRLRVGVGRPRSGSPERHLLSDFSREEGAELPDVLESASAALRDILQRGPREAMNLHNADTKKLGPAPD